ncbi:MAG: polyphosphate kinase 2 [Phycisphaeraceae bacterium]|nr:polyphosphate kinase 2 [Phycisphaeraceae bacterium]
MSKKEKKNRDAGAPGGKMPRKQYEGELEKLQIQLCHLQEWVKHAGLRVIVVFEGRDAAGKGGVIKRITERVSPRVFRVVALPPPSDREKTQLYMQRYITHFPSAGQVVLFDRSWYNRAGVERVMGFCTPEETEQFLHTTPFLEEQIVRQGITLIKYFFDVSQQVQQKRFDARARDPMRHWKLSPMDVESWRRWWDYTAAYAEMIEATNTDWAPWYRVHADKKRQARLNCISHLLSLIHYEKLPFDPPERGHRKKRPDDVPEHLQFTHNVPKVY